MTNYKTLKKELELLQEKVDEALKREIEKIVPSGVWVAANRHGVVLHLNDTESVISPYSTEPSLSCPSKKDMTREEKLQFLDDSDILYEASVKALKVFNGEDDDSY